MTGTSTPTILAGIDTTRFPIRFTGPNRALAVLGLTPRTCYVDVSPTTVVARMGWSFRARIDRSAITAVAADTDRVLGWGAHGWRGVWLLNGSSSGIVRLDIDPPTAARVLVVRIRLRALRVSLEDPAAFAAALEASSGPAVSTPSRDADGRCPG